MDRWLAPDPHRPGTAERHIKGTGLPVWRVIGQIAVECGRDSVDSYREIAIDGVSRELIEAIAAYYGVDENAIRAALAYARRHRDAIVARLVLDRAALSS
jgi:uncharacterized protein (DUF433 family)